MQKTETYGAVVQAAHICRLSEEILSEEKDAIIEVGDKTPSGSNNRGKTVQLYDYFSFRYG